MAIQRSDKRIHLAVVTEINRENSWVTVEWVEKGVKKGKKIKLETVFLLNPALASAEHQRSHRPLSPVSVTTTTAMGDQRTATKWIAMIPHRNETPAGDSQALVVPSNPCLMKRKQSPCLRETEKLQKQLEKRRRLQLEI